MSTFNFAHRLIIIVLWINYVQVQALYFPKAKDEVQLSSKCSKNSITFYEGYVMRSAAEQTQLSIDFRLEEHNTNASSIVTSSSLNTYNSSSEYVGIRAASNGNSQAFHLYFRRSLPTKSLVRVLNVTICAKNKENRPHHSPCMLLKIRVISLTRYCENSTLTTCFGQSSNFLFNIYENSEPQTVARLSQNFCRTTACGRHVTTYSMDTDVTPPNATILRLTSDGLLELTNVVNREKVHEINLKTICESPMDNGGPLENSVNGTTVNTTVNAVVNVTMKVKDENEHGPIPFVAGDNPNINLSFPQGLETLLNDGVYIGAKDRDAEPSTYLVEVLDDKEDFFYVTHEVKVINVSGKENACIYKAKLHSKRQVVFPGNGYAIRIRFEDLNLTKPGVSRETFLTLIFQKHFNASGDPSILDNVINKTFEARLMQSAANHSRVDVHQMVSVDARHRSGVKFYLVQSTPAVFGFPFDITPSHGILYVNDSRSLRRLESNKTYQVKMCWKHPNHDESDGHEPLGYVWINVHIIEDEKMKKARTHCSKEMCSSYDNGYHCERGCGQGSVKGYCQWREQGQSNGSDNQFPQPPYSTCSPDISTCPDNTCDELETLYRHLCPQDCVLPKDVFGTSIGASIVTFGGPQRLGIPSLSTGICSCTDTANCKCDFPPPIVITEFPQVYNDSFTREPSFSTENNDTDEESTEQPRTLTVNGSGNDDAYCGWDCVLSVVIVILVSVIVISVAVFCFRKCYRKKLRKRHHFPGSLASLPAIPSDYVDERSSSVVSQNLLVNSDLLGFSTNKFCTIDSKWEFPRSRLILEQTLGEGEFGRVVKAKALNINHSQPGYTTVAVKMLKSNGSSSEQDLLSEFNLLKEVCHPNVIRLLGICMDKEGPLCIIVEYAEFGALRTYLRKSRRLEFKSCTSDDSGVDSMANGVQAEPQNWSDYQVNSRDLLSFAWQIAKGMEYLSIMKLVHRDLAARNILVAANKAVKISDFGMTRDVYEGDTYFKKSMGRVPVKWLAIESLLDHIYTTRSDVWSFGIVLWEIVTLGAAPYPGVAPERLYHLLKSGYRMEKPDNCSDELYDIMRRCWRESPNERPSFAELTKIFDQMLQANVEYLDLGVNIVHNLTYFEDIPPQTETIDEEGDDSEMGYGSWNALPNDDDEQYLASNPPRPHPVSCGANDEKEEMLLLAKPLIMPKIVHCSPIDIEEHTV